MDCFQDGYYEYNDYCYYYFAQSGLTPAHPDRRGRQSKEDVLARYLWMLTMALTGKELGKWLKAALVVGVAAGAYFLFKKMRKPAETVADVAKEPEVV